MRRALRSVRLLFGLAMVLGMLISVAATPASAHHGARITIHHAACEPQVQDIFGECHDDRIAGTPFKVAGVWREADGNGVVSWTPGAGTRTIVQDAAAFDAGVGAYVFCSNQVTGAVLFDGPIDQNRVTITTTAGQAVVCDWYTILPGETSDTTLTVYTAACPAGYEGDDYYADCSDNPWSGVEFGVYNPKSTFEASGTSDGSGVVTFQLPGELAGDIVNLTEVPPVEVLDGEPPFAAFCTRNGGQPVDFHIGLIQLDPGGDAFDVEIGGIVLGDQLHCDWFNLT
ncbi:MAG: hypothetical protein ACRDJW_21325 [Thermomicrobiales bacterium]